MFRNMSYVSCIVVSIKRQGVTGSTCASPHCMEHMVGISEPQVNPYEQKDQ